MAEPVYTRCPGCATIFRVSNEQIALRDGQVRCGQCRAVFDANNHRLALDPPRDADGEDETAAPPAEAHHETDIASGHDDAEPAVTEAEVAGGEAADSQAAKTQDGEEQVAEGEVSEPQGATPQVAEPEVAVAQEETTLPLQEAPLRGQRFEWKPRKSLRERPKALYGALIALLVVGIAAQALLEYRGGLAAHAPFTRPILGAVCAVAGCTVGPLHDAGALSIDASDLRADPAHHGLLKLTATIRNRASYPIAWPHLELTLTDASDNVVARRALAPTEYAGPAADPAGGIPGNGEDLVTLFIDASQTSQAGYRLYLFYP
ncbi:MAG TPA: DUF3426 domain-containing protein [Casimicrobiaceae bacterium]|nr:DUF3426 domain-containing protein [Casimicrobiaceae bacterium]